MYYLISNNLEKLRKNAIGGVIKYIKLENLKDINVKKIDIVKQEKIINQLDKVQKVIDIRKKQIEQVDELINLQFIKMFGDIRDTKYNIMKLEDLSNLITDGEHKKPNYTEVGKPFISVANITTGKLDFNNCKYVSDDDTTKFQKRCNPKKDDILYTKIGTYGKSEIVDTDKEFSLYVSVCLIKPKKELVNPIFMNHTMRQPYVKAQADKCIKGIGVPDLHLIEIKKFDIIVPPMELQNQFAEFVKQVDKQKIELQKSLEQMQNLQMSLMDKYFRE